MHAFHNYLSKQLGSHLRKRCVVVWYDTPGTFEPYLDELISEEQNGEELQAVRMGDLDVQLVRFTGSFFGLRASVEPFAAVDEPKPMLIYVPGITRDRTASVLMELEKAGMCYEPQLKRLARHVLRQTYTDGVIDEVLASEHVIYEDIVRFLEQSAAGERASLLKVIFEDARDSESILARWLADDAKDSELEEREAAEELFKLVEMRLGFELPERMKLTEARSKVARFVLVSEFRADLGGDPPGSVSMIPQPPSKDHLAFVKKVTERMRERHPDGYVALADQVGEELGLAEAGVAADALGSIDTFRFEDKALLTFCGKLVVEEKYADAMKVVDERSPSFWVGRDVGRQAQWEACRLMADLGLQILSVKRSLPKTGSKSKSWVDAYATEDGWYQADLVHRRLEAWISKMDDEPETEKALGLVRRRYEQLVFEMAERFSSIYRDGGWTIPGALHQTRIYPEFVEAAGGRVAYFMVDAMRYEMGAELMQKLQDAKDLSIRPAVAALPTVTPVGMAALLPGASASFSVVEGENEICAKIDNAVMRNASERMSFLKARAPDVAEILLGQLLQTSSRRLEKQIGGKRLVVVRSQEIDALGEIGDELLARQVMDTVIGNVARAVRKLSGLGIEHFVITADHGHLFSLKKEEDMRTDNPGGQKVEAHRRCWIGHGGTTPPGTVRVTGAELGYDTNLEFVFPRGLGVLRAGGGLRYHHGGISLQELLVPVITLRIPSAKEEKKATLRVSLSDEPKVLTNRTFGVKLAIVPDLFNQEAVPLRAVLLSKGEQVGQAGMAVDGEFDRETGCVSVEPDKVASVGMMLVRDDCESVRIVVQDPKTDAVLYQSKEIPVKLGDMTMNEDRAPARDALDDKANRIFAGKVVRKDLVRKVKVGANVPAFVLEYLLGKYCASSDEMAIQMGLQVVNDTLTENYIRPDESTKAQSRVKEQGKHTFIDKVKVRLVDSNYWAEVNNFGHKYVHIPDHYVRKYDRLLTGGIWAQVDMRFEYDEETRGKYPFWIDKLTPIQIATFDLDEYRRLRNEFTSDEWIDLMVRSMGYEPAVMDRRLKLQFLARLIPLCERNFNIIELGPRGTGKSYVIQELSPYAALITGPPTVATMFGHLSGRYKGMVEIWDAVAFDEVADLQKMPKEIVTTLKTYCESGQFQRGREAMAGYASIGMFGNTQQPIDVMVQSGHLFAPMPNVIRNDMAFLDRIHFYLPGWEIPKMRIEHFTDHYGFVVDYMAEALRELRKINFTEIIDHHYSLGAHLNARDRKAVRRSVSGLMKILHPHGEVSREDLEEILSLAIEGRRRVKEQLKKMGSFEYYNTSFSYIISESGEERFVGVPEQGGRDLISPDRLPPGTVYTASVSGEGTVGLYRIEVSTSSGTGKLKLAGGVKGPMKESIQRAFSYILSKKTELGIGREVDTSDFHVEAIDLLGNRVEAEVGVAFFVACYSILRRNAPQPALLVLGDMSIQGNIKPARSLVEPLQVAMDNGAKRALIPIENKRNFFDVSADVLENVDPIFFGDLRTAAFKALGLN